jgi:co-chaperonin GroES (HSP10)
VKQTKGVCLPICVRCTTVSSSSASRPSEQVRGGIIIPDTAKEKPQEAEVIAVGEGKFNDNGKRIKLDVKKGDKVLIGKYSGSTSSSTTSSTRSSARTKFSPSSRSKPDVT